MKVFWKDKLLFEVSDMQKRVIMDSKCLSDMDACNKDLERRVNYFSDQAQHCGGCTDEDIEKHIYYGINEVYNESYKRIKKFWEQKLIDKGLEIPEDKDAFTQLVLSQADYKDRATRDQEFAEERAALKAASLNP